ncbi:MAG: prohibitin family protein [Oscillospiraceae bacterium]|nr:prohibitin family protein [Oscillospiraceae bacterium]
MAIKFIISFILIVLTAGGFALAYKADRGPKRNTLTVLSAVFLVLLAVVPMSIFSVNTGEIGVVKVFGEAKSTVHPGINFRLWLTDTIDIYDVKTRQIDLESLQAYSKDAQTVTGRLAVQYQIEQDKVIEINRQYGTIAVLEEKLKAIIVERAKSVFSDKGAMLIVESRSALSGEIKERIESSLGAYHVTIGTVALEDISFNEAFENAVEQKMVAEQEKLRSEYDKERAIIKADEQLEVAEREALAAVAKANGDAEALQIMQSAWSKLSAEVKDAMLRQTFYEKWDGVLPEVMAGENLDLIIGDYSKKKSPSSSSD